MYFNYGGSRYWFSEPLYSGCARSKRIASMKYWPTGCRVCGRWGGVDGCVTDQRVVYVMRCTSKQGIN